MSKRMLVVIFLVAFSAVNSAAFAAYTEEEQYVYDNLYLQLPWEPAKYQILTQENRDTPTHLTGSVDEYALDFGLTENTPVVAAKSGVAYVYMESDTNASDYGNHVKIDHGYFYTLYAHLTSINGDINGCEVRKGDVIGYSGNTGVGTGFHLHFGLYHGYAWNDGYSYSVQSKVVVANEGYGPFQTLSSMQFENWHNYLSGNFKDGEEGIIVCDNDECHVDTNHEVGGAGGPVSGERPDFTPDFDVYHLDGHEISANCDDCPTEKVRPGQVVRMRLEVETHNRDVQVSDLRNSGTDSIDGKISCRVVGKTSWQEIPGSENGLEYDVDNLETDNNSSVETIDYTIPDYPGAVLECQATVDDDDEVIEESESNNNSRIERFQIENFAWLVPIINSMNQ